MPPLLVVGLALLAGVAAGWLVAPDLLGSVQRWWSGAPVLADELPVPLAPLMVIAGIAVLMGARWWWPLRVAVLGILWALAARQLGLTSGERLADLVHWLASQPGVDVFDPPPRGSVDAMVVMIFALALAPFVAGVVLFVLWAWSAFVAEFVRPLFFGHLLPDWVLIAVVLSGMFAVAAATRAVWLPWCLWVLGVVARAVVIHAGG
jgi:hypothetical protein